MRRPAVFLDRDGTLNLSLVRDGKPYPPRRLDDFSLYPDVPRACRDLAAEGFALVVVTNQPDVGRGALERSAVEAMHAKLRRLVPQIERVEVCYDPGRGEPSRRRKPATGMLADAVSALDLDLAGSWMVGDRWRDVDCGRRARVRTVFIDRGYAEELRAAPDHRATCFAAAAAVILRERR